MDLITTKQTGIKIYDERSNYNITFTKKEKIDKCFVNQSNANIGLQLPKFENIINPDIKYIILYCKCQVILKIFPESIDKTVKFRYNVNDV